MVTGVSNGLDSRVQTCFVKLNSFRLKERRFDSEDVMVQLDKAQLISHKPKNSQKLS
jgi:hypothetical protein